LRFGQAFNQSLELVTFGHFPKQFAKLDIWGEVQRL
jgi:hypothetical protein